MRNTINFLGVNVDVLDTDALCDRILLFAKEKIKSKIMYVNADCMLIALKDNLYRKILNQAELVYADGIGIVLGARILGRHLPGRSTAADFMPSFCQKFTENKLSIYLFGAHPHVAEEVKTNLKKKIPGINIVGTRHGYFKPDDNGAIINDINKAKPDILIVGLGAPKQEKWIHENTPFLNVSVVWGVGGLFDFLSERTPRGPRFLVDNGFEWLCRFMAEPRRLGKRYLVGNVLFLFQVIRFKIFGK